MLSDFPQPPVHLEYNRTVQAVFTLGLCLPPLLLAVAYCLRSAQRNRSFIPLLLLVGGFFAAFHEVAVDVLGLVWFPREGQWKAYEAFGRPIPLLVPFVYPWYFGGQALYTLHRFQKGVRARDVWRLYLLFMAVDILLETPGTWMDAYQYYGKQPFRFLHFPLWWAFMNATIPLVVACAIHKLRPHLVGWRVLAVLPLPVLGVGAVWMGTGLPTFLALNTRLPVAVTWLAATTTGALCALLVWFVRLAVAPAAEPAATVDRSSVREPVPAGT